MIRWVCEKDSKKWIYPIEKCIYCRGPITKQKGKRLKVIGISKVNIASPMHPIIPYYVILLEDEYGNKMPKKVMREYKIGDNYEIKPAKSDNAVVITKIKYDMYEYLKESILLLHQYGLNQDDKIVIKPTIIEPAYAYQAVNTNPKVMDALILYLKELGINDVIVAEQAMPGNDTISAAEKTGIIEVCKKYDVPFIDLSQAEYTKIDADGFSFNIAKDIVERKIINVPVVKTNSQIGISAAMENMTRVVDRDTQKRMFDSDIEKTMPKLLKALPGFLNIGDASIGMQGNGPTSLGEPAFLNMLLASKDPVAMDKVASEIFMLPTPDYVKNASDSGMGVSDIQNIEIVGDEIDAAKYRLKPADKDSSPHPRIKIIDGKSNPYIFKNALDIVSKLIGLAGYEINLAIGSCLTEEMLKGRSRIVVYGDDAIQKVRGFGLKPLAEISEKTGDIEKIILLKSILEDKSENSISITNRFKSKLAKAGAKVKKIL